MKTAVIAVVAVAVLLMAYTRTAIGAPTVHEGGKYAQVFTSDPALQYVSGLTTRPGGGFYASTEAGKIVAISQGGSVEILADLSPSIATLSNIAVDTNGMILVGDAAAVSPTNNIWAVSPVTGQASLVYGYAYSPTDIHLDAEGNLLVVERLGIMGVSRIARDGSWKEVVFQASDYGLVGVPTGFDLDANGNLFVGYRDNGRIYRLPPGGSLEPFAGVADGNSVLALAFSPDGDLFAANDLTGDIFKIDATGTATLFASGIDRPRYMTFGADGSLYFTSFDDAAIYHVIPEPATMSLLALGLGAVFMRRKRRS